MPRLIRRELLGLVGSTALVWPCGTRAQQPPVPVVGFVSTRGAGDSQIVVSAFRQGLGSYFREPNVAIEFRWAEGNYQRLPELIADLLGKQISVLVAVGGEPSALAAHAATTTVPIVFMVGGDPVALGLVQSYSHPGGNATGFNLLTSRIEAKRIGILHELLPNAAAIGVLLNPKFSVSLHLEEQAQEAAQAFGQVIKPFYASTDAELEAALSAVATAGIDGLLVTADPFFDTRRDLIIAAVGRARAPAIYQSRDYVQAGGLMSYGISYTDLYRQAGAYVGQILKGTRPSDLPVVQPVKFELMINVRTAKTLGLTLPQLLFAQADDIIE